MADKKPTDTDRLDKLEKELAKLKELARRNGWTDA